MNIVQCMVFRIYRIKEQEKIRIKGNQTIILNGKNAIKKRFVIIFAFPCVVKNFKNENT